MARTTSSYQFEQAGDECLFSVVPAEKRIPMVRRILGSFGVVVVFFKCFWS